MRHFNYILLLLIAIVLLSSCGGLRRMKKAEGVTFEPSKLDLAVDKNYNINVSYTAVIPPHYVKRKAKLTIEPRLAYFDQSLPLTKIVVMGKNYERMLKRDATLNKKIIIEEGVVVVPDSRKEIRVKMNDNVVFQTWMIRSDLNAYISAQSCCSEIFFTPKTMANSIFYMPPSLGPVIIENIPKVAPTEIKDMYKVMFAINLYDINPKLDDNSKVFESLGQFIKDAQANSNITIDRVDIVGYASPDGEYLFNSSLSEDRADAIRNMLISEFKVPSAKITKSYIPEDWKGLYSEVESSDIKDKEVILNLINSNIDDSAKSTKLRQLPQFKYLVKDILPQLRRVTITIIGSKNNTGF